MRSTLLCRLQSVHRCYGLPKGRVCHLRRLLLCVGPSYYASAGVVAAILLAFVSAAVWSPVCWIRSASRYSLASPRLTVPSCNPNISSFAPAPSPFHSPIGPPHPRAHIAPIQRSAVLLQVKRPVTAGSNVTARSAAAVRSLNRQLVIAPRCWPGCVSADLDLRATKRCLPMRSWRDLEDGLHRLFGPGCTILRGSSKRHSNPLPLPPSSPLSRSS